ncbi:MAG: BON domain-containing protein [Limnoraphis robusta]|jgi:osmotically-inducible protein OsmY|uniref:Transporter n=1 Tax=Limnoraphis robusta CS-951 TaxID=1637645 RepID=A0A0F5Y935_9CYAN|nr:BON domain-containing protein [Limnoraphis robusta]KKD35122.1 transporter [Limnoraphis robusta CS-951]
MKKLTSLMIGSLVLLGAAGCDVARTSADAPTSIDGEVKNPRMIEETKQDADKNIRQAQLNSDIRAREERNNWSGDRQERSDSDLESEVRAKLEANIQGSKLTVQAEDGAVIIAGTVPSQREYETIEPLSKEILGVDSVDISRVEVVEPTES